jgi:hypothetical protein
MWQRRRQRNRLAFPLAPRGVRTYWRLKSRPHGGRPMTPADIRQLTARPSADWIARQLTEAYGWQQTPAYIVRDRDCVYGDIVLKRLRAWAYEIGRSHRSRHGNMDIRRGSSGRSDGSVLTMLLCSASDISAICSIRTKIITTRLVRTYLCTRTRRSHVPCRPSVARWRCRFLVDCTINILERKFPTGTGMSRPSDCAGPSAPDPWRVCRLLQ